MFREHHYSKEFTHSKYELNQTTRLTLLSEIDIRESGDCPSSILSKSISSEEKKQLNAPDSNTTPWHPVTLLHHICNEYKLPTPVYQIYEENNSKRNVFTCEVKALEDSATGVGVTKREAKRLASQKLLCQLKNSPYLEEYPCFALAWTPLADGDKELVNSSDNDSSLDAISELNNFCSTQKWPFPVYALLSAEGPSQCRTFTIGCTILGHPEIGEGCAPTKKEAKRAASRSLLDKINKLPNSISYSKNSLCSEKTRVNGNQTPKDPITTLHETCASLNWPHPTYEILKEEGPSNSKVFTIGCFVQGHIPIAQGMGHTKSEAKHSASQAVLEKIKKEDTPLDAHNKTCIYEQENESISPHRIAVNATSLLNALCISYKWPYPKYEYLPEINSVRRKIFVVECALFGYSEKGKGYTKREAKHAASVRILMKMRSTLERSHIPRNEKNESCESKDPTTSLYEFCASNNWPHPNYELLSEEGPTNRRTFTIGCVVTGYSEMGKGTGHSKSEAKHEASRVVLNQLKQNSKQNPCLVNSCQQNTSLPRQALEPVTRQEIKDPISALHELCASRNWSYPTYVVIEEGSIHQKIYVVTCTVLNYSSSGNGHSKSEAKRSASLAMLDKLHEELSFMKN